MNDELLLDTLNADMEAFLHYIEHERRLALNTRLTYKRALAKFAAFVEDGGILDYRGPKAGEIARYVEALHDAGLAPSSRAVTVLALRLFYGRLVELGQLSATAARPVLALAVPALPARLPNVLTVEGVRQLLQAPSPQTRLYLRDRALLEFLYASACRASEAADLRLDNVDLDGATARVWGKGSKERVVLLGEPAVQALGSYLHLLRPNLAARASEPPWLFLSHSGQRLSRALVWMLVKGYADKAGLPEWVNAHSLRHAAGTHLLQGGADVRYAQEFLGHANVDVTMVYLHLDVSHLRQVHERFEEYRGPCEVVPLLPGDWQPEEWRPKPAPRPKPVPGPRLPLGRSSPLWTPEEDDLVRTLPAEEAARRTGKSLAQVYRRRARLLAWRFPRWSEEEDELVRILPFHEAVARLTGRTPHAIEARRKKLGLQKHRILPWTEEEDQLVRTLPFAEAVRRTGRSRHAVRRRRKVLGCDGR